MSMAKKGSNKYNTMSKYITSYINEEINKCMSICLYLHMHAFSMDMSIVSIYLYMYSVCGYVHAYCCLYVGVHLRYCAHLTTHNLILSSGPAHAHISQRT